MTKKKPKRKIAVIDFETDPFLFGRVPEPFCVEFYSEKDNAAFWGDDCAAQLIEYLDSLEEPYLIYAHNGGKFDFHFLHSRIDNPALIIKNRIVEAKLGIHTLRDSFAILPVPLRDYEKMAFDYSKMEKPVREKHKNEILEYLHSDCINLFNLVSAFVARFGPKMTIGGTAIGKIRELHPFTSNGSRHDKAFRPFYYGGRVQCFKAGIIKKPVKMFDINSAYPHAMRNFNHPINGAWDISDEMPDNFKEPFFIHFTGTNRGALPSKKEDGGLTFTKRSGEFFACSHEIEIALKYNLITIEKIHVVYTAMEYTRFDKFVDMFYEEKAVAKEKGDVISELFAKLLLNSGYGRTGINPANFEEYIIHRDFGNEDELEAMGYEQQVEYPEFELWSKPAEIKEEQYCDVAIAASITSAARSVLLEGIQKAINPIYCDTDCIICEDFNGDIDPYKLGAWDLEKTADNVAIAGKKMYVMFNEEHYKWNGPNPNKKKDSNFKLSSKGGTISMNEIIRICNGEIVKYEHAAPLFSLRQAPKADLTRNFRITVDTLESDHYA